MDAELLRDLRYFLVTCAHPVLIDEEKLDVRRLLAILDAQSRTAGNLLKRVKSVSQHMDSKDG